MPAIIRIGLVSFLVTAAAAGNLEFTDDVPELLSNDLYFEDTNAPFLKSTFVNPEARVQLKINHQGHRKGINFIVVSGSVPEQHSESISVNSTFALQKSNKGKPDICNGKPGLVACLSKLKRPIHKKLAWNKNQTFCFSDMYIDIATMDNLYPYMRLDLLFFDPENGHKIGIRLYPFKASKNPDAKYPVPRIRSPIPLEELPERYPEPITDDLNKDGELSSDGEATFTGDISWLKDILYRARLYFFGNFGPSEIYTEYYEAGPVILERKACNGLLRLNISYKWCTSKEEN